MKQIQNKKCGMPIALWRILILAVLTILLVISLLVSISQGAVHIPISDIIAAFSGNTGINSQILLNIRLPRALLTILVGMNLAVAGAILQAVMKNPLADPHIIGISSGAGIAGIFIMIVVPQYSFLITPVAFVGAMAAAISIYILAWKNGIKPLRIILAGVAVASFIGAGISALLILYSDRVHGALMWMVGGFAARSWVHVHLILPYTIIGIILAMLFTRHLNVLQLGDEIAKGLGMNVERIRIFLTAIAALLAASSVAVAGLLGFVGLIIPHTARLIIGSDYRFLLPASVLLGGAVVALSDTVARCAFAPLELPVGIFMAILGAPFFLFLLRRQL
ncbi:FecCD family ABC transporter permease [Pectinatus brassicae]|uniref:Iron complex transport system permease protein n=1 Tax=Pectinatus brassicae TaxID=862415 RepID=A0A840UM42_9FIRM|nr:iron ABC transporter permease [Pectinatus brassicae]MBB5335322.1 iron complex transport system permease protein [Pectinatus brassicae]